MNDTTPEPGWETAAERKLRLATPEPAQWTHIDGLVPTDADPEVAPEHHLDPSDGRACFACWCYACGGRTDRPRVRGNDTRTDLVEPDSHRWCFE